jgi:hypothetical protein
MHSLADVLVRSDLRVSIKDVVLAAIDFIRKIAAVMAISCFYVLEYKFSRLLY